MSGPRLRLGLVLPTTEIGTDPDVVRGFGQAGTRAGFDYVLTYDHVVGADVADRPDWPGPYTVDHQFHEPFVVLTFLATVCDLDVMTGVLILPQRQTVLVAKQAAALDVLSGGRLRLGVGTGWNEVEYQALGVPFADRGARFDEQVVLLRRLWSEPTVTFAGDFDTVDRAGISPLPVQRPIPVWLGGWSAPKVLDRIGRMADGWLCHAPIGPRTRPRYEHVLAAAETAGRRPEDVGLQGLVHVDRDWTVGALADEVRAWRTIGADGVSLDLMRCERSPVEHVELAGALAPLVQAAHRMP